jgi:hypothetical protein
MIRIRKVHMTGPFKKSDRFCKERTCLNDRLDDRGFCKRHAVTIETKYIAEKRFFFKWKKLDHFSSLDMAEQFVANYGTSDVVSVWHKDESGYFKFHEGEVHDHS